MWGFIWLSLQISWTVGFEVLKFADLAFYFSPVIPCGPSQNWKENWQWFVIVLLLLSSSSSSLLYGVGIESKALCMLGKRSTTGLHGQPFSVFKKNFCLYRYLNWDYICICVGYIIFMEGHKKICVSHYYIKSPHLLGISICYKNLNRFHFWR